MKFIMPYPDIQDLCISAARYNRDADVTGFMIECGGVFLQAVEGREEAVDTVLHRTRRDSRHHHIDHLLSIDGAARRQFGAWAMNLMFLDDARLWRRAVGPLKEYDDFLLRSRDPVFSLGLLSLAYRFACSAMEVDPAAVGLKRGRVPSAAQMLKS